MPDQKIEAQINKLKLECFDLREKQEKLINEIQDRQNETRKLSDQVRERVKKIRELRANPLDKKTQ